MLTLEIVTPAGRLGHELVGLRELLAERGRRSLPLLLARPCGPLGFTFPRGGCGSGPGFRDRHTGEGIESRGLDLLDEHPTLEQRSGLPGRECAVDVVDNATPYGVGRLA